VTGQPDYLTAWREGPTFDDPYLLKPSARVWDAYDDMVTITPTSPAGIAALARHILDLHRQDCGTFIERIDVPELLQLIVRACEIMAAR
jgi:hypothetical protein